MRTIRGVTFYEQEETPGLGGEIAADWFRKQFVGKSIVDEAGNPGIIISSGGEPASNKVDAISGATMTCDKVQAMLNEAISSVVEEKQ
jgi:Na+-transporting NADH:ubiquinone oxidoreductase subunit C